MLFVVALFQTLIAPDSSIDLLESIRHCPVQTSIEDPYSIIPFPLSPASSTLFDQSSRPSYHIYLSPRLNFTPYQPYSSWLGSALVQEIL